MKLNINISYVLCVCILVAVSACDLDQFSSFCSDNSFDDQVYSIVSPDLGPAVNLYENASSEIIAIGSNENNIAHDLQITKLSNNNDIVWSYFFGNSFTEFISNSLKTKDDGYLIIGYRVNGERGIYIVKTDDNGDELWDQFYESENNERIYSSIEIDEGGYILVGFSNDEELIMRIDENGNEVWRKTNSYSRSDVGTGIQAVSNNEYLVYTRIEESTNGFIYGIIISRISSDGSLIWSENLDVEHSELLRSKLMRTKDDHFIVASTSGIANSGEDKNVFMIKFDEDGEEIWRQVCETEGDESFRDILELENGEYFILADGESCNNSTSDLNLIKVNSSGNTLWQKIYGGSEYEAADNIILTQDGTFLIGGIIQGMENNFDFDLILLRVDENGDPL